MRVSTDRVMIISNPDDEHTVMVVSHLEEIGISPVLLYPECFGESSTLSLCLDAESDTWNCYVTWPGASLDLDSVSSVWYRRPRLPLSSAGLTEKSLVFARDEWHHALKALYAQSPDALWISRPDRLELTSNKPRQLQADSFFASLECVLIELTTFRGHTDARLAVFDYIEGWHNPRRRHSALGYLSSVSFERHHELTHAA